MFADHEYPIPTRCLGLVVVLSLFSSPLHAENATKAGRFHVEHPTLLNLGFEWAIEGDDNRNATVAVQFRPVGDAKWRDALPLVRIGGENVYRRHENLDYTGPPRFRWVDPQLSTRYGIRMQFRDEGSGWSYRPEHTKPQS